MDTCKTIVSKIRTALVGKLPPFAKPAAVAERFLKRTLASNKVLGGPFRGMHYVSESIGSVLLPKTLGCYELELQPIIERYLSRKAGQFIDVGAAEGYYAVGLASRCPASRVVAFEALESGRNVLRRLAELNGVSGRVDVHEFCAADTFERAVSASCPDLIIMDVEGGENELLRQQVLPLLEKSDLIVELHPWICPTIESDLKDRFARTHQAGVISTRPRTWADLPFSSIHNYLYSRWFIPKLDEMRPEPMRWLVLTSLKRQSADE